MTQLVPHYRFSADEFVRAWEAGVFDSRVELIEGEVWPVVIGGWHGRTVGRVMGKLELLGSSTTNATLPSGGSLPDPDCWVARDGAQSTGLIGSRVETWSTEDVLLVVEVSDTTVIADLTTKARIYGTAGYAVYWVITEALVYEHTGPKDGGYSVRREYARGEILPIHHLNTEIAVEDLLGPV